MFGPARQEDSSQPSQESLFGKLSSAFSLLFSFSIFDPQTPSDRGKKMPMRPTTRSPSLYVGMSGQTPGQPSFNLAGSSLEEVVRNANAFVGRHGRDNYLAAFAMWIVECENFHICVESCAPHHPRLYCQLAVRPAHNRELSASLSEAELVGLTNHCRRLCLREGLRNGQRGIV